MAIVGHWEESEPTVDRPREPRRKLSLEARGALGSGGAADILVHDISVTGLLLESPVPLMVEERIAVDLPHAGATWARVVWTSGRLYGCQFHSPISAATLSAAQLRSAVGRPVDLSVRSPAAADTSLATRLQRLRKERGISQAHIATKLGVSKPTVWAWEHGRARPAESRIADLASVLGVTSAELLSGQPGGESDDVVTRSRDQIAAALGTRPEKVRIWVEL